MVMSTDRAILTGLFPDAPLDSDTVLSIHDVSVVFGGLYAVSEISFDVRGNDLFAIIGPNGAGKSTTLNAVSGLVPARTGTIRINERSTTGLAPWRVAEQGVGRAFQDPVLIDKYTVIQNVLVGAHRRLGYRLLHQLLFTRRVGRYERDYTFRARALLEFFDIEELADVPAGELPYGPRKLVDIARAMIAGPRLLLLDEPSSGLDRTERRALESALLTLRSERLVAIVAVEHHMDLVRAVASHVVVLQAGTMTAAGPASEVLDSTLAREALAGGPAPSAITGTGEHA